LDKILKGNALDDNEIKIRDFFDHIGELEKKEYQDYLEWIYYEMERQAD